MKPRILIAMHYMEIGGAESALIGLLHSLDYDRVDVDLFLHAHRGEMMQFIPERVNLLPEMGAYSVIEAPLSEAIKRGHRAVAWGRIKARMAHRREVNNSGLPDASIFQYVADRVAPRLPNINPSTTYNLAISFLAPHNYVLDKVDARVKIGWIHTDYSKIHVNTRQELKQWSRLDYIASISDDVTKTFTKVFPSLADKIILIENILPRTIVLNRADEFEASTEMTGKINLLSIGRFTYPKNFDNIPDIARRMVQDHGLDFKWYIIGYGGDEAIIRTKIAEAGMEDRVIILGKRANPYPYIRACDIYVQPSRYEGKSVTVREAQMLCKPVVITDYPTARSQVNDGLDGVITPMDNTSIARTIASIARDQARQNDIIGYIRAHDYSNASEVDKIYNLLQ
ncbi:MAG: glycosyltransferase [Muribaculaceae bacterium]|nr:glycosyltransferase [Muribaculaceae bacterium]